MRVRALVLLFALTSCGIGFGQVSQPRYSLTISAVKPTVRSGSEIRIRIVQENTTDTDQMFRMESKAGLHGEYLYLVDVRQLDGKKATRSEYFREVRDEADHLMPGTAGNEVLISKKPGETIVSSIDLNELYELKPGKYAVRVFQKDDIGKATVTSNTLNVSVTP